MNGGDTTQLDVAARDRSTNVPDALDAAIEDVFDRLMTLDGAMGALADAEVGMAQALQRAEAVADAYHDRPEHAEALCRLHELRDVAHRTLDVLMSENVTEADTDDGPPARGSSPRLVTPRRPRRDTIADSPRALREVPALAPELQLLPCVDLAARGSAAHMTGSLPDEEGIP